MNPKGDLLGGLFIKNSTLFIEINNLYTAYDTIHLVVLMSLTLILTPMVKILFEHLRVVGTYLLYNFVFNTLNNWQLHFKAYIFD